MKIPKLKNKGFNIQLGIYPYTIFVSFGDVENFRKIFKEDKYMCDLKEDEILDIFKHFEEDYAAQTFPLDNGNVLIHFKFCEFKKDNLAMINTIAHESLHATEMILTRIGMKLNRKTDEAFCYLHGYIVEQICKEI